jgi:TolA protein
MSFGASAAERRLYGGLLVSLLLHALVLLLQFGVPGMGMPGAPVPEALTVRLANADPAPSTVPTPAVPDIALAAAVQTPPKPLASGMRLVDPAPPPEPVVLAPVKAKVKVNKGTPRRAKRISPPLAARETLLEPTKVIAQDSTVNDFAMPVVRPEEAEQKTLDIKDAQAGDDDGDAETTAALEAEAAKAGQLKAQEEERQTKLAEEAARKAAEALEAERAQVALEKAAQLAAEQRRSEQARAEQQKVEQQKAELLQAEALRAQQQRADQLRAEQQKAEQQRADQLRLEQQKAEQLRAEQQKAQLRLDQQKAEQVRVEQQKAEQLRAEQQKAEQQKAEQQKAEQERLAQQRAEQQKLAAEQQKAEQARAEQQKVEQARAEQQKAEQARAEQTRAEQARAEQQRAADQRAERERGERQAAQAAQAAREREALQAGSAGAGGRNAGPGGAGTNNAPGQIPRNMLGSDLANRARDLVKGLDVLSGDPPGAPRLREGRRVAVGPGERDVSLKMYVESWRQKIERNASVNFPRNWVDEQKKDPLVSVAVRSDGTVEEVTIVVSSGRADMDEAVRRIVRVNARYSAFPPDIAKKYDVIDIRRVWRFDETLKLLEEVR